MTDEVDIERIVTVRLTRLKPEVFFESNPGTDPHIAQHFADRLAAEADRRFMEAVRGAAAPERPAPAWPPRLNFMA